MSQIPPGGRKQLRWSRHDYAAPATYLITLCIPDREPALGRIHQGKVVPSDLGQIVRDEWLALSSALEEVDVDEFVVMPDHLHGIVKMLRLPAGASSTRSKSLWAVMQRFKSITTRRINLLRSTPGESFWQRSYHDRIIRDPAYLIRARNYIRCNPSRWGP